MVYNRGWFRTRLFCNLKRYLKNSKKLFRKVLSFPTNYLKKNSDLEVQLYSKLKFVFLQEESNSAILICILICKIRSDNKIFQVFEDLKCARQLLQISNQHSFKL
jgi:hypothetical protein